MEAYVVPLDQVGINDIEHVGGKNASLGEMISGLSQAGVMVPGGFATTASAYREFLAHEALAEKIDQLLSELDTDNLEQLANTGATVRKWVIDTPLPEALHDKILIAWKEMGGDSNEDFSVAVRSSATAEDLPDASFAGQQETFLN
ncbi:MAG: PEP/pyruvate-binding domain-containing protein, partial [Gammaproteobacteria bacterium]|nr:PEP/pyruvate-binding domain-containing protein [Gammaproteobacteria bacterium]